MITRGNQRAWETKRDVSLTLNMTNGIFGGAELSALKQELHTNCATKVAPPILLFLLLWDSAPSLAEGARGWVSASEHNVRA